MHNRNITWQCYVGVIDRCDWQKKVMICSAHAWSVLRAEKQRSDSFSLSLTIQWHLPTTLIPESPDLVIFVVTDRQQTDVQNRLLYPFVHVFGVTTVLISSKFGTKLTVYLAQFLEAVLNFQLHTHSIPIYCICVTTFAEN